MYITAKFNENILYMHIHAAMCNREHASYTCALQHARKENARISWIFAVIHRTEDKVAKGNHVKNGRNLPLPCMLSDALEVYGTDLGPGDSFLSQT